MMGLRKSEAAKLDHTLHGLIHLLHDERIFSIADQILNSLRPKGLTFGAVDLLLAPQSHVSGYAIFSYDKIFKQIAASKWIHAVQVKYCSF